VCVCVSMQINLRYYSTSLSSSMHASSACHLSMNAPNVLQALPQNTAVMLNDISRTHKISNKLEIIHQRQIHPN